MGMEGYESLFNQYHNEPLNDGEGVILVDSSQVFCNDCTKDEDNGMGFSGESSIGIVCDDESTTLDGVFICDCGKVFVITDNKKYDVFDFVSRKRIDETDDTVSDFCD